MIAFLRGKFSGISIGELARMQIESIVLWLVGGLPSVIGYAARNLALRMLGARVAGVPWIQPGVTFVHTDRLSLGSNFGCNTGTYINAVGGVTIGSFVLIGSNVTISSGRHPIDGRTPPIFARPVIPEPIVIEDGVWIGAGAVIMPGVTLARGSVVGANAVVTRSTLPFSVNAGVPSRCLRIRAEGSP